MRACMRFWCELCAENCVHNVDVFKQRQNAFYSIFMLVCLFVHWVICFQSQNETATLSPEMASILAAFIACSSSLLVDVDVVCSRAQW